MVSDGVSSQSEDEKVESLVHNISDLQSLSAKEEGSISQKFQEIPLINSYSFLILEESHV